MTCVDHGEWPAAFADAVQAGAFRDAILCPYQTSIGGTVFALMAFGGINIAIYNRQNSVLIPFVLTLIVGTAIVPQMPGIISGFIVVLLLFVVAVGPVLLLRRMRV